MDEIDIFIRIKYGYPLTKESYMTFPVDLIREIYYSKKLLRSLVSVSINSSFPSDPNLMRGEILYDILLDKKDKEYWIKSDKVYSIIKEYDEQHQ